MRRRVKRQRLLLVTVAVLVAGCSTPSESASESASTSTVTADLSDAGHASAPGARTTAASTTAAPAALPSVDAAKSSLESMADGEIAVVKVGNTYEAISVDSTTTVRFWRMTPGKKWTGFGTSERLDVMGTDKSVKVSGARPAGADHAVFIVDGGFGTGGAPIESIVYARDSSAWGWLTETGGVLKPGRELGGVLKARFEKGQLVVLDSDPTYTPLATMPRWWVPRTAHGSTFRKVDLSAQKQPAVTYTHPSGSGDRMSTFKSPDGRYLCWISDSTAACGLNVKETPRGEGWIIGVLQGGYHYQEWPVDDLLEPDSGWATDTTGPYQAVKGQAWLVLPAGSTITSGTYSCTAAARSLTCKNTSGASFTLADGDPKTAGKEIPIF